MPSEKIILPAFWPRIRFDRLPITLGRPTAFERYVNAIDKAKEDRVADNLPDSTEHLETIREESPTTILEFKKVLYRKTQTLSQLVMMDNTIGKVFPGSLLWAGAVRDGQLHELEQVPGRPPVTVTFAGLLPKDLPSTMPVKLTSYSDKDHRKVSFKHNGTYADFEEHARPILAGNTPGGSKTVADYQVSTSLEEAMLEVGISAKYWIAKMSANLNHIRDEQRSVALLSLDQVYYTATTDAPPLGGYLPDEIVQADSQLAERLADGADRGGEIVYVRKVDYGRKILIALSAEATKEELKRALSVSLKKMGDSFDGNISDEVKKIWNSVEGKLVVIGGAYPEGVSRIFGGDLEDFITAIQSIMASDQIAYNPEFGAVPVAFELGYVSDNAPMQVFETVEFAGKIPTRRLGKVSISQSIITTGTDASVIRDDSEMDSDDWTKVQLTSQNLRLSQDQRTVHFDLVWHAFEAESNKTIKNDRTVIRSSKTFSFPFPRKVDRIESHTSWGSKDQWYAGEIHRLQAFPSYGLLSNIRVRFDQDGDNDDQAQYLQADLQFTVWLEE